MIFALHIFSAHVHVVGKIIITIWFEFTIICLNWFSAFIAPYWVTTITLCGHHKVLKLQVYNHNHKHIRFTVVLILQPLGHNWVFLRVCEGRTGAARPRGRPAYAWHTCPPRCGPRRPAIYDAVPVQNFSKNCSKNKTLKIFKQNVIKNVSYRFLLWFICLGKNIVNKSSAWMYI